MPHDVGIRVHYGMVEPHIGVEDEARSRSSFSSHGRDDRSMDARSETSRSSYQYGRQQPFHQMQSGMSVPRVLTELPYELFENDPGLIGREEIYVKGGIVDCAQHAVKITGCMRAQFSGLRTCNIDGTLP